MLVLIKSYYCTYISHILSPVFHLSVVKTGKPEDEQLCITVHTINNSLHDADPLDNSSCKAQIKWQPYITIYPI